MPPRGAPGRGRGAPVSFMPRGGAAARGGGPPSLVGRGNGAGASPGLPARDSHITTVGVRRSAFGTAGRVIDITTNHFLVKIPDAIIHHYDVVIRPDEKTLPARLNMEIIDRLQKVIAPQVFTPRAVYDGRKNLFAARELPFGETRSQEFDVMLEDPATSTSARGPKVYKVKLTHVAEINPEVLARFLKGQQSHDNTVLTAITALNVVIRMEPSLKYPFNVRSFFTNRETKDIGGGIVLWRGYFQSVRPAIGKMLINVDISTGTMYKEGPLFNLCLEFFGTRDPSFLTPRRLTERERLRLQRFISGVRVTTVTPGQPPSNRSPRVLRKLSAQGASSLSFTNREGKAVTVAQYFRQTYNFQLKYPDVVCAEVGNGALIPLEMLHVPPGQIMKKPVPPEKTKDVLEFATKKPQDRLQSIANGLGVLQYGQSEYVRQFGLDVDPNAKPMRLQARVLNPPTLKYGPGSKQPTIVPRDGAWNMVERKFWQPCTITQWILVVFERRNRFDENIVQDVARNFVAACKNVGITIQNEQPIYEWANPQSSVHAQLARIGGLCGAKYKTMPNLVVCVLPEGATDVYTAIKHFGDIQTGCATQCLKADKCKRAKEQYFANVCLKVNVKLGGINTIPEPRSVAALTDPHNPTIVMGADVIHPAPGAEGRPSFTALVANVDSDTAKYVADCRVQTSRQELIEDLGPMSQRMLWSYMDYRKNKEGKANPAPTRIIFYRDGVSEGQFKHVLEQELPLIKKACANLNIKPKITMIVVGKRHHVRFFPQGQGGDRSGNCPAGTVVDREVTHPLELDWYLQSHAGLLGTSRPAHYSVLHDENNFTPDSLQALSFALCHVYARSTRSVSIPAPVYYADIVCSRAKNHYNPEESMHLEESSGLQQDKATAIANLSKFKSNFKPLHSTIAKTMYFS
ncbi:argonaute-like protein [Rhodofomes roseus]|uniref:Argonaute-like protein n=1 Tax=Rhodofomes roseus TaxID=34475 RepID=A0ABQ8L038_9APHY|nr:argonaute-like protein [Rhodofomes roseus]KAH9844266.1 argonaute-like protein [Rhodofomes roseus]